MNQKEKTYWINAVWAALDAVHRGPGKWKVWNAAEYFFMQWIEELEAYFCHDRTD